MPVLQQLVDLFGDGLAHAGDILEPAFLPILVDIPAKSQQAFGGFAISQGLIDDFAFNLGEIGDQGKYIGKLTVIHAIALFGALYAELYDKLQITYGPS